MREELRETEKKLSNIVGNDINKALQKIRMIMERMMTKKDKHSEGSNKERKHHRHLHYQREEGGVEILIIVIFIHHPLNIIIGIKLQPIPMNIRLTLPLL